MQLSLPLLIALIGVALAFDFLNGLHDAANSIATVVSTRVLTPQQAVLWAAFFNFIAFAVFGLHVAQTVGKGIIDADVIDAQVIFGALMGAIAWNVITWRYGIPSSSSHALIGGLLGAGISKVGGFSGVVWSGVIKTVAAIFLSPAVGLVLALALVLVVAWTSLKLTPLGVDKRFRKLQLISAAMYSLGHGGNDAQKTMGIIAVLLYSQGLLDGAFHVPFWVVIACQAAMALGTMSGGWKIVHTMGSKITRLTPAQGFCAETGGRHHAVHGDDGRHPGILDAHHHRRDRRRRLGAAAERGPLERRQPDRHRLGGDAARRGADRRGGVRGDGPAHPLTGA